MPKPPEGSPSPCNETFAVLDDAARAAMVDEVSAHIERMFGALGVDVAACHNTRDSARRHARMLVCETLAGRYTAPPRLTDFDNALRYEDMIVTGPIEVRSTCAHHLMPIYGEAYVAVLPSADGRIIGLSKYDRVVEHFASRYQIQEELTRQIADYLVEHTTPAGVAVRISAVHMCKTHRGVRASRRSRMVTTVALGAMADRDRRAEFVAECAIRERGAE